MNKNIMYALCLMAMPMMAASCSDDDFNPSTDFTEQVLQPKVSTSAAMSLELSTDKAIYSPSETVAFTLNGNAPSNARVRYRHGADVVDEQQLTGNSWTWTAPESDGMGYLVDVYTSDNGSETVLGTIGIDVSSSWTMFPRYGFVSDYDDSKTDAVVEDEVARLNRYHINGVQFYDWQYAHHRPLLANDGTMASEYTEIANRQVKTSVVAKYISEQHRHGMKAMWYDLCYGALDGFEADGVSDRWLIFSDANHSTRSSLTMPDGWKSDIYLTNPGNTDWQRYMASRASEVYRHLDFDGYHVDQVGDRGVVYDYYGSEVNLENGFCNYLKAMKSANPDKRLVMNAVSSYGSKAIANSGATDFMYNEVWTSEPGFRDLHDIVRANDSYTGGKKQTVFAAYLNYHLSNTYFNTPGVLTTDAVMFALGASHIELSGDHMLYGEYFPDKQMRMDDVLQSSIVTYYDFLTAYENYLRGGGTETKADVYSGRDDVNVNAWPPALGSVTAYSKTVGNNLVVSLLNFRQATTLNWRDDDASQPEPDALQSLPVRIKASGVKRVWTASPDFLGGAPQELDFTQGDGYVTINVPYLKYWTMIVLEQ